MGEESKDKGSVKREASALLQEALAQFAEIKNAQSRNNSPELSSAAARAREAVMRIRSAIDSGDLSAASLASLMADLNLGVDTSALAAEGALGGVAKAALAMASHDSRATVESLSDDIFRKHLFDADVERHTHGAELEAFRRRQAEDEKYIHAQLARHTADGDLKASGRMEGSMLDAHTHGAGDNAAFMPKWNELKAKTDKLRASMQTAGLSTEEYDKHIREDVEKFLKAKGLSEAEIRQALAKSDNPLDAVQPYLASDKDSQTLTYRLHAVNESEVDKKIASQIPDKDHVLNIDQDAINARLAAAGFDPAAAGDVTGHGLNIQKQRTNVVEH